MVEGQDFRQTSMVSGLFTANGNKKQMKPRVKKCGCHVWPNLTVIIDHLPDNLDTSKKKKKLRIRKDRKKLPAAAAAGCEGAAKIAKSEEEVKSSNSKQQISVCQQTDERRFDYS